MIRLRWPMLWLAVAALAWPGSAGAQDWDAVMRTAAAGGTLTLYHNLPPPGDEPMLAAFKRAFPKVSVETVRLGSTAMMQRFSAEAAAGRSEADVVMTLRDEIFDKWIAEGYLREWSPPEAAAYPPETRYKDHAFAALMMRSMIAYNPAKLGGATAPKEWQELFDPKWKGLLGMDPPWRSVAVQAMISFWESRLGIAGTARPLKENGVRFFGGSAGVVQALIRGDIAIAAVIDPPVMMALDDGAPLKTVYPASGIPIIYLDAMVPQKAPHPELGMSFANWLLSAEGQLATQDGAGTVAVRPGTRAPKHVPSNAELKLVPAGTLLTPDIQQGMIRQYRDVFGVQ